MFEDRTYENILSETLAKAPSGVDTRPGSIFYDAVAGVCLKIAKYYADLSTNFELVFIASAADEYLDQIGDERGVLRNPATRARYEFAYEGSRPTAGERFFTNGEYFALRQIGGELWLEAETTGRSVNYILPGTFAVPLNNIAGLISASFGELIEPGADTEKDDSYRQRVREKLSGPAENGNRQHYKTWCEEIPGVGRARILPLWDGENTVKGVLFSAEGTPSVSAVVERVQEYIDPGGTGLGNGKANIGAHFTAVAAEPVPMTVSFSAVYASDSSVERASSEATEVIKEYLKGLAINTPDSEAVVVRISAIGALLHSLPSIIDYSGLTLNEGAGNIEIGDTQVAVLQEVAINASV